MITVVCQRKLIGAEDFDFLVKCLSTDTKPSEIGGNKVGVNSICYELDTGDSYYLKTQGGSGTQAVWEKVGGGSSASNLVGSAVVGTAIAG